MDGQAVEAPGTEGLADLASFLADEPEQESVDEATPEEQTSDEVTDSEETAEQEDVAETEDDEPAPERKIKVTIRGEDNSEQTEEVTETELVKGYQRQADYTRKTQALAQRENDAVQVFQSKFNEAREHYTQQAELVAGMLERFTGFKSDAEMAQLANADPAAWVAENQRRQTVLEALSGLKQSVTRERQQAEQQAAQQREQSIKQAYERTWAELSKAGIDQPALGKIFGEVSTKYGFTNDELSNVYDARIVKMMKDATAYQALLAKKGEVTKKVNDAPRLATKQPTPANERKQQELNAKFKNGRAKLADLAAYLN